jgi:tripartite-type tricarboxylate transporter receptor subunit TctC
VRATQLRAFPCRRESGWHPFRLIFFPASIFATTAMLLAAMMPLAGAPDAAAFYAGKVLKIIVGLPPGGGADAYARLLQRHLPRQLPGAPAIMVQNVPGAGSLKSIAYLDAQPDDGTVLNTFSPGLLIQTVTAPERFRVDFRNYGWVGNVGEDVRVCYLWHSLGVRSLQDLAAHGEVVMAASAVGTAGNIEGAMLRDLFGIKIRRVEGYAGAADKRLAVEKGEVDGDCAGWTALPPDWLREGKIDVIVRLSPTLLPGMDQRIPFARELLAGERDREVFDFLMAPEKLGRMFMVSPRVPAERLAALRQAFDGMAADPAFRNEATALGLALAPMSGSEVARDVAALYAAPSDVIARAKAIAGE